MRARHLIPLVAGAVLLIAACTQGGSAPAGPTSLTVWLMTGSAPESIVSAVNTDFEAKHPGVKVKVELQQWSNITTKLDTGFAGSAPPDVIELGNTLVAKYAAGGALEDLSGRKSGFENSSTWLQSLTESCTVNGKLYCVPYYAGSRAIIYRKDLFASANVQPPRSTDELLQVGRQLMNANRNDANFSALYFPGKYWYAALPFVWDSGGDIAIRDGSQWRGALDSPQSVQGLTTLKTLVDSLSRADRNGDELKQDQAFAQGHIAMLIANGWEVAAITDPKDGDPSLKDKLGVFPIPSRTPGQTAPVFLGGSDLAVGAKSKAKDLARDWVKLVTGAKYQTQMATVGQVIPNTTTLLDLNKNSPLTGTFADAAKNSRFTPNSPNWANVEGANVLPNMLVSIFTGKASVQDAARSASEQVTKILNAA